MSPQQFSLRWNNHTKNLVQVFADQFERQQHVDVTISCQGKFLKAHKIVLGACSPYFQELFDSHESAPHPIIIMNGYSFEDIRSIVEFMYRGEVMVAETAMQRLLAAAEDLQIKGLSNVRSKRDSQQQQQQQGGDDEEMGEDAEEDQDDRDPQDLVAGSLSPQQQINGNGGAQFGSQLPLVPLPAENAAGGRVVKRRKRTRAVSYDNNEMKRKLRIQSNKSSSNNSQNNQTSGNADHHQQSSGTSPTSQGDDVQGGDGDGGGGQCGDAKDSELMMTINIEPPSVLMNDDDSSSVLTTSKDQEGQGNGEGNGVTNNISTSSSSSSNNNSNNNNSSSGKASAATGQQIMIPDMEPKEKIPRPPNSFMIFANEWRRQLAGQFPNESNKEISVRLGVMWKNLAEEVKAKYFTAARRANDDHKKKYPDYHYNPKEARMRKMWKLQQQSLGHLVTTASHH